MPRTITIILDKFIGGVREILGDHLKKIILYGSYARGDYNESSDIDIMILVDLNGNNLDKARNEIYNLASDFDLEYDVTLSPLVKNIDRFNYWSDVQPFYINVLSEGVILHG